MHPFNHSVLDHAYGIGSFEPRTDHRLPRTAERADVSFAGKKFGATGANVDSINGWAEVSSH